MTIESKYKSYHSLALLLILIIGLGAGQIIVTSRSKISLSDQIKLKGYPVSVSLPAGSGWQTMENWKYDYNNGDRYLLEARLIERGRATAAVRYTYVLGPNVKDPEEYFGKKLSASAAQVHDQGTIINDDFEIIWAQISRPVSTSEDNVETQITPADTFIAVMHYGNTKMMDIEAVTAGDSELAEKLFEAVSKSVTFKSSKMQERGKIFVDGLNADVLRFHHGGDTFENIFVIEDKAGNEHGFSASVFSTPTDPNNQPLLEAKSFYVLKHRLLSVSMKSSFETSTGLDSFFWQSQYQAARRNRSFSRLVTLEPDGKMTVAGLSRKSQQSLYTSENVISEVLLDDVCRLFLGFGDSKNEAVIEIITSNGDIIPAVLSIPDTPFSRRYENAEFTVRIVLLDSQNRSMELYFDDEKNIIGKLDNTYSFGSLYWKPSDRETIRETFGEIPLLDGDSSGENKSQNNEILERI